MENYIAWGNNEPCPICTMPFKKPDIKHFLSHPEALKILFPNKQIETVKRV